MEINNYPVGLLGGHPELLHCVGEKELKPAVLMGTSLGGLYIIHADLSEVPWCKRIVCNPACHIVNDIREKIGFGVKEYFVPRQDGIQQYVLDEDVCRAFESDSRLDQMAPGDKSLNFLCSQYTMS